MRRQLGLDFYPKNLPTAMISFQRRKCKYGPCQHIYNFQCVANFRDVSLFEETIQTSHCLHQLLPCVKTADVLHPRGNNFTLPKRNMTYTMALS
jgi:hypothetical protein